MEAGRESLRETSERLDALLQELDRHADARVRERLHEVVALLMALHGAGLERVLALAAEPALGSPALRNALADDPVVGPLLLTHGLHPYSMEVRVARALERLKPRVAAHGCRATLAGIENGTARVRVEGGGRVADRDGLRQLLESGLVDAAPELEAVVIENETAPPAAVPLIQITRASGDPILPHR